MSAYTFPFVLFYLILNLEAKNGHFKSKEFVCVSVIRGLMQIISFNFKYFCKLFFTIPVFRRNNYMKTHLYPSILS